MTAKLELSIQFGKTLRTNQITMLKKTFFTLVLIYCAVSSFGQSQEDYIKKYKKIAIEEMERAGIPASIKLAQGILESNSGKSTLARKARNHFGMKCGSQWTGDTYYLEDDDYNERGELIKSCFRVYRKAKDSYVAHSEFLRDPRKRYRYGDLFKLNPRDYKAWARGLKAAGYATSPTYAEKLIKLIERHKLYQYDQKAAPEVEIPDDNRYPEDVDYTEEDVIVEDVDDSGIMLLNDAKMVLAEREDTPLEIAGRTGVAAKCIVKYNEKITSKTQAIPENSRVYLQRKRNAYRGKKKYHQVKEGETMYYISQAYGTSLKRLRKRNRIKDGYEPKVGSLIKLRGWKVSKRKAPKTIKASGNDPEFIENTGKKNEDNKPTGNTTTTPTDKNTQPNNQNEVEFETGEEIEVEEVDTEETFDPFDEQLPEEKPVYHQVEKGDTLYGLSRRYGVTVDQIKAWNNLTYNTLSIGQRLRVK